MRDQVVAFLAAWQFLTICPPIVKRSFTGEEMGRAAGYFPLVGALLGALLVLAHAALWAIFPSLVAAALLLAAWVAASGALHLDGFLDTCDGVLGGFTPEDRLRIMRDERIGGFALAGGVLLLLVKLAALASLAMPAPALFLAPVLGRWAMSVGIVLLPYGRAQGLGRDMKERAGRGQLALATLAALAAAVLAGWWGAAALATAAVVVWLATRFMLRRLPGLTGDTYGALCEATEAAVLLVFCVMLPAA